LIHTTALLSIAVPSISGILLFPPSRRASEIISVGEKNHHMIPHPHHVLGIVNQKEELIRIQELSRRPDGPGVKHIRLIPLLLTSFEKSSSLPLRGHVMTTSPNLPESRSPEKSAIFKSDSFRNSFQGQRAHPMLHLDESCAKSVSLSGI